MPPGTRPQGRATRTRRRTTPRSRTPQSTGAHHSVPGPARQRHRRRHPVAGPRLAGTEPAGALADGPGSQPRSQEIRFRAGSRRAGAGRRMHRLRMQLHLPARSPPHRPPIRRRNPHPRNLATLCWWHHHVAVHRRGMRIDPQSPPQRRRLLPTSRSCGYQPPAPDPHKLAILDALPTNIGRAPP